MPLERSDAIVNLSDPTMVVGPCKRRPTERLLENGDPLTCKRARNSAAVTVRNASTDKENWSSSPMPPPTRMPPSAHLAHPTPMPTRPNHPTPAIQPNPGRTTDSTEISDSGTSDGAWAIVVEDSDGEETDNEGSDKGEVTDEDDDAELGM